MAKRKAKKAKVVDSETQSKIDQLKKLLDTFKAQATEYENYLNSCCVERCKNIEKLYQDKLNSLPENIKNMTIMEVLELEENERKARETECPKDENLVRMQYQRQKMTSEKKRTQRREKKRSISVSSSGRNLSNLKNTSNNMPRISRACSENSLLTPLNKQRKPSMTPITPKFNPNAPVRVARKPKPGEIVMSLSGSPLRNFVDDLPLDATKSKKLTLPFEDGKVILIEVKDGQAENEFLKSIDKPVEATLKKVQDKLNEILKNGKK